MCHVRLPVLQTTLFHASVTCAQAAHFQGSVVQGALIYPYDNNSTLTIETVGAIAALALVRLFPIASPQRLPWVLDQKQSGSGKTSLIITMARGCDEIQLWLGSLRLRLMHERAELDSEMLFAQARSAPRPTP
ncbi:hypothetical protein C8Q73DRAFT_196848 [Cubamyces lactineus]|nr:hypothetical protein C8Q73DRAFT_196848 [Cubamyces lactineus]